MIAISPNIVSNILNNQPIMGRHFIVYYENNGDMVRFCGTSKKLTLNAEPVNITQDCDGGFRRLAGFSKTRDIEMELEGVMSQSDPIITSSLKPKRFLILPWVTVMMPGFFTISGKFMLSGVDLRAPLDDAIRFTAKLKSSGKWQFTALE